MKRKPNFSSIRKNMKKETSSSLHKKNVKQKTNVAPSLPSIKTIIINKYKSYYIKYGKEYFKNVFAKVIVHILVWPIPLYALLINLGILDGTYIILFLWVWFTYFIAAILFYLWDKDKK